MIPDCLLMDIQLKKSDTSDLDFFFQVFREIKILELKAENWPERLKIQIVSMQYDVYEQAMKNAYPQADNFVILVDSVKAGRLQIDTNDSDINIINISLLPAFQKQGIGSKILDSIIREAKQKKKTVYLKVDKTNPAVELYRRFNFRILDQDDMKYFMSCEPLK
jgi:ribosomal protein S18 acetylase RimI-like enzyme